MEHLWGRGRGTGVLNGSLMLSNLQQGAKALWLVCGATWEAASEQSLWPSCWEEPRPSRPGGLPLGQGCSCVLPRALGSEVGGGLRQEGSISASPPPGVTCRRLFFQRGCRLNIFESQRSRCCVESTHSHLPAPKTLNMRSTMCPLLSGSGFWSPSLLLGHHLLGDH